MRCPTGYSPKRRQLSRHHHIRPLCRHVVPLGKVHFLEEKYVSRRTQCLASWEYPCRGVSHFRLTPSEHTPHYNAASHGSLARYMEHCFQCSRPAAQSSVEGRQPRTAMDTLHDSAGRFQQSFFRQVQECHHVLLTLFFCALLLVPAATYNVEAVERHSSQSMEPRHPRTPFIKRHEPRDSRKPQFASRDSHQGLSRRGILRYSPSVDSGDPPAFKLRRPNHLSAEVGNALNDVIVSLIESHMAHRPPSEQADKYGEMWNAATRVIPTGASAKSLAIDLERAERMLQHKVSHGHHIDRAQFNQRAGLKIAHAAYLRLQSGRAHGGDRQALHLDDGLSVGEDRGKPRRKTSPPESKQGSAQILRRAEPSDGNQGPPSAIAARLSSEPKLKGSGDSQSSPKTLRGGAHLKSPQQSFERESPATRRLRKRGIDLKSMRPSHELDSAMHRAAIEMSAEAPHILAHTALRLPPHHILASKFEQLAIQEARHLSVDLTQQEVHERLTMAEQWRAMTDPKSAQHRPTTLRVFGRKVLMRAFQMLQQDRRMSKTPSLVFPEHHSASHL